MLAGSHVLVQNFRGTWLAIIEFCMAICRACLACTLLQNLGQRLRSLLKEHGTFKAVEMVVRKSHEAHYGRSKEGEWCTKQFLQTVHGWTPPRPYPETCVIKVVCYSPSIQSYMIRYHSNYLGR